MIRGRNGERWAKSFHAAPWISYAEALCWIFYRDVEKIAALGMFTLERDYADMGCGMVEAVLSMEAGVTEWQAAAPELSLLDALEAGQVKASGHPFVLLKLTTGSHHGKTARREIEPLEWLDMQFYDAPAPLDRATTTYPKRHVHGMKASAGVTDIWFSRADLTATFPGHGANQILSLVASAAPLATGPGIATDFLRRDSSYADARRKLQADGKAITKGAMLLTLAQMFHDAGGKYQAADVSALAESFKARCSSSALGISLEQMIERADRADRKAAEG